MKTKHGIECTVFKRERTSPEAMKRWGAGIRSHILKYKWPVMFNKILLTFDFFSIRGLGEFLVENGMDSGIYDFRDWIPNKSRYAKFRTKYHRLALVKLKVSGFNNFSVIPMDLRSISRHNEWRKQYGLYRFFN